jgi:putative membrane protein
VSAKFFDDDARTAFEQAITTIESDSAVEVVVALRRRSYAYRNANLVVGAVVAFISLAAMLFVDHPFSLPAILLDPFIVGIGAGLLVEVLAPVKRLLTPGAQRRHHVRRAALATFVERGVHVTTDRSGLLVYISWLEQQVALVPDVGLSEAITADALATLERELTHRMREGGAAVGKALAAFAPELAQAMPRSDDDVNELPDALDSDLRTTRTR